MENTKEIKIAAALSYKQGDRAPIVVAKGKGYVAEEIINNAKKSKIPIHIDEDCAKLLSFVELGSEIPEELYEVVAKILAFLNEVDRNYNSTI